MEQQVQPKKRGRPVGSLRGNTVKMYGCSVDPESEEILRIYGGGNFSKGVRMAAQLVKEQKFSK